MINRIKNIVKSWTGGSAPKSRAVRTNSKGIPWFWDIDFLGYKYNDRDFREFICNAFGMNPHINMVVPRITDMQSSLPRSFKNREGEIVPFEQVDKDLLKLIESPNPVTTRKEFYDQIDQYFKVTGNSVIYGISPSNEDSDTMRALGMNKYAELYTASIVDVDIMTDNGSTNGIPVSYQIANAKGYGGSTVTIPAKDVLHLRNTNIISPETNYGLSQLFGQQKAYTASNFNFDARVNTYKNGGKHGIVSPKGSEVVMQPEEQEAMQTKFDSDTAGVHNFGGVHVSGSPVDFTRISLSPEQLKLIESLPSDLRHACAIYDVDSVLFGDVAGTTFNNLDTARKRIEITATRGGLRIDEALNKWLIKGNFGLDDLLYTIDAKDEAREAKVQQRNTDAGKTQIIGIAESVAAKSLSENSAIGTLQQLYAYSEDEAKEILGL